MLRASYHAMPVETAQSSWETARQQEMFNLKQDREKEKTEYYTSGKKAFQERDFAQACRFFHFAEAWKIKKTAWENLKLQIQEKLNKIPEVEDNLTSTSLMLISLSDIEETLSSIPENPEGSDRKPENALFFMFHGQSGVPWSNLQKWPVFNLPR